VPSSHWDVPERLLVDLLARDRSGLDLLARDRAGLSRLAGIEPFLIADPLMSLWILVAAPCASELPPTANASAANATPIAGETRIGFENTLPPSSARVRAYPGVSASRGRRLTPKRGERV